MQFCWERANVRNGQSYAHTLFSCDPTGELIIDTKYSFNLKFQIELNPEATSHL